MTDQCCTYPWVKSRYPQNKTVVIDRRKPNGKWTSVELQAIVFDTHTSKQSHFLTKIAKHLSTACHDFTSWCRTAATPVTWRSSSNCITSVPRPSLPGMRHSKDATTTWSYEKRKDSSPGEDWRRMKHAVLQNNGQRKVCHLEQIFERTSLRGGRCATRSFTRGLRAFGSV